MNKLFTFIVGVCCAFAASAQDPVTFVVDNVTYEVTGDKTVSVSGQNIEGGAVTIPSTVENNGVAYTVTAIGERAFYWSNVTKIVLPETVTEIARYGIYNNSELEEIVLPKSLKQLGDGALSYNIKVKSITIPDGITVIPASCFSKDDALAEVVLPESVEEIGNGAFYKVPLKEFVAPKNLKKLGDNVFQLAPNLEKVVLGMNVEELGDGTFRQCAKLTQINFQNLLKLKEIPSNLFIECISLSDITIPVNVEEIGMNAFGNTAISEFKVAAGSPHFTVVDGVVYSSDKHLLYLYPPKKVGDSYAIDPDCVGISAGAFYGSQVKKMVLPESIVALDGYVFCESKLEDISLPNSIVYIGEQAFAGTNLKELVLPEKLTMVSDGLAAYSKQLTKVTIPADVRIIYNHAFIGCTALTEMYCKAGAAPVFYDYYDEDDSPFGYITNKMTLHVPQGSLESYKDKGWSDFFSNIEESEPAAFVPVSTNPATDSWLSEIGTIDLAFAEEATVVETNPAVTVRKDSELSGEFIEADGGWIAVNNSADKKTVSIFPSDYDGFTAPIKLENEVVYYVAIPAGIIKNAEGVLNQKIVLALGGKTDGGVDNAPAEVKVYATATADGIEVFVGSLANVQLFDIAGKLVAEENGVSNRVNFRVDNSGLYIVRVSSPEGNYSFKVLK